MKKGTFKGLLFREFYMDKKSYLTRVLSSLILILVCLLGLLSFKYGNLGKYAHLMGSEIVSIIKIALKYYPAACTLLMVPCMPITAEKPIWNHFRHSCPVPPFRFALAKYCHLTITVLLGCVLYFLWLELYSLLTGTPISLIDLAIFLIYISIELIIMVLFEVAQLFFKSTEYFVLFFFMFGMIVFFVLFIKYPLAVDAFYRFEWIKPFMDWSISHIPKMIFAIAGTLLVGLGCTTIRLRRREK